MLTRLYLEVRRFARELLFERRAGIDTEGRITMQELGLDPKDRVAYEPAGWLVLRPVLSRHDVKRDDVFLDMGCGKGRVLYLAAQYPFARVIGVELSTALAEIAKDNIQKALPRLTCKTIEIVNKDVLEYDVPDDVTYVFFNNPFEGAIFAGAVTRLVESVKRRPRVLRIIYYAPTQEDTLLAAGARLVKAAGASWPYTLTADSPSVRLYVLDGHHLQ